ncbi:hypothetical protein RUND412_010319, partial [Rhizina undulata]
MSSYEDDHDIQNTTTNPSQSQAQAQGRVNLANFITALNTAQAPVFPSSIVNNENPFAALAEALREMESSPLLELLVAQLRSEVNAKASVKGVPEGFLDTLERVEKGRLKKEEICSICNTCFLDDPHPLVVRLPCHPAHMFDLECIAPWLKLHTTCPLDRVDIVDKKKPAPQPPVDDEEEVWDEDY